MTSNGAGPSERAHEAGAAGRPPSAAHGGVSLPTVALRSTKPSVRLLTHWLWDALQRWQGEPGTLVVAEHPFIPPGSVRACGEWVGSTGEALEDAAASRSGFRVSRETVGGGRAGVVLRERQEGESRERGTAPTVGKPAAGGAAGGDGIAALSPSQPGAKHTERVIFQTPLLR